MTYEITIIKITDDNTGESKPLGAFIPPVIQPFPSTPIDPPPGTGGSFTPTPLNLEAFKAAIDTFYNQMMALIRMH